MTLDGAFLYTIGQEIQNTALDSRVDRIYQPSREEMVLLLRGRGWSGKLMLSAGADSPRIHFTKAETENPKSPPMFCMLLRKHLSGARLTAVRQLGLDRVLYLDFDTRNELGDPITITVAVEIMGRHSNIIIVGPDGRVLDAIKRIDPEMSGVRPVLPGLPYTPPPAQDKLNLFTTTREEAMERIQAARGQDLSKALMASYEGLSGTLCREIVLAAVRQVEADKTALTSDQWDRLFFQLNQLKENLLAGHNQYTILCEQGGRPKEFSFVDLKQYGMLLTSRYFDSPSELLDSFYSERVRMERMKQRSNDLLRLLMNASERLTHKLALQREELAQCADREKLKQQGDLLSASVWQLKKGMTQVELADFYHDGETVTIPLDPALTPVQNIQWYYKQYRKAATAEQILTDQIQKGEQELTYVDSVFDAVSRTSGESELLEIRQELAEQGYLKHYHNKNKLLKAQPPLRYRSSDGFTIWCGRNNRQNDRLTLRDARPEDIWFHTQGFAGSHVILVTNGIPLDDLPDRTVEEAAMIAAWNSRARAAALVPVDYTQAKNVRKPGGAKPGMVIFDHYFTLYTTPDEEKVAALEEK